MSDFELFDDEDKECMVLSCDNKAVYRNKTRLAYFCSEHMSNWSDRILNVELRNFKGVCVQDSEKKKVTK